MEPLYEEGGQRHAHLTAAMRMDETGTHTHTHARTSTAKGAGSSGIWRSTAVQESRKECVQRRCAAGAFCLLARTYEPYIHPDDVAQSFSSQPDEPGRCNMRHTSGTDTGTGIGIGSLARSSAAVGGRRRMQRLEGCCCSGRGVASEGPSLARVVLVVEKRYPWEAAVKRPR